MPNLPTVILRFGDGETVTFDASRAAAVLDEAERCGVTLASDCRSGACQTCLATLLAGEIAYPDPAEITLDDAGRRDGAVLPCQARAVSPMVEIALPYTRASLLPARARRFAITRVRRVSASVWELTGACQGAPMIRFLAGQYVNFTVPGGSAVRSYSMMTAPGSKEIGFLIRAQPRGAMSTYLSTAAKPGDILAMKGPYGTFYRRHGRGPLLLVAGGTGLAPILSILRDLRRSEQVDTDMMLAFGVTAESDFFYAREIEDLRAALPKLSVRVAAMRHSDGWHGMTGTAVDLLDDSIGLLRDRECLAYVCGPPPMMDAARARLTALGIGPDRIFAEVFRPASVEA